MWTPGHKGAAMHKEHSRREEPPLRPRYFQRLMGAWLSAGGWGATGPADASSVSLAPMGSPFQPRGGAPSRPACSASPSRTCTRSEFTKPVTPDGAGIPAPAPCRMPMAQAPHGVQLPPCSTRTLLLRRGTLRHAGDLRSVPRPMPEAAGGRRGAGACPPCRRLSASPRGSTRMAGPVGSPCASRSAGLYFHEFKYVVPKGESAALGTAG